jgi:hypothetical protein
MTDDRQAQALVFTVANDGLGAGGRVGFVCSDTGLNQGIF